MNKKLTVLVVLCSMSQDRFSIAKAVLGSLKASENFLNCNFLIIDNGSKYTLKQSELLVGCTYITMPQNLGYWGILHWAMYSPFSPLYDDSPEYIYIVESDHIHFAFNKLNEVLESLDSHPEITCARVAEFSVRYRHFFSKENRLLPFRRKRSLVSTRNAITKQKASFVPIKENDSIYLSNWHARLPSVFRYASLKETFNQLALRSSFTEHHFFEIMHEQSSQILVLDKGIFYPASSASNSKNVLSGSWMQNYGGKSEGYQPTRIAQLKPEELLEKPINILKT